MKVMMIQLPHLYEGIGREPTIYPLGIGYLVSSLKEHHETIPLDLWIENASVDYAMKMIGRNVPDVFCISVYSTQYPYFKEFAQSLKTAYPNIPIITGGPGATFSYRVMLEKSDTDFCVIGEGEVTLGELLFNMDSPHDVRGIAFRNGNNIVVTPQREQIKVLDTIPFPDRTFFDFERYILNSQKKQVFFKNMRCNTLITSRGCPYNCRFCSKTFSGSRIRSIEGIDEEIGLLKTEFNIEAIDFDDELVLLNKKRALEVCEMMKRHGIPWGCQGRINLIDEDILQSLKDAGCRYVGYGVESYTQKILDKMNKKIRVEQIVPAILLTKRHKIEPVIQYMYGYPGEDDASIRETYQFFKAIDHPYIGMITTPLPGTALYQDALEHGFIENEESYMMQLTSGYNYAKPLVNFTGFSEEEFLQKRASLEKRVNGIYYAKHPLRHLKYFYLQCAYRIELLFKNPKLFFSKALKRISTIK